MSAVKESSHHARNARIADTMQPWGKPGTWCQFCTSFPEKLRISSLLTVGEAWPGVLRDIGYFFVQKEFAQESRAVVQSRSPGRPLRDTRFFFACSIVLRCPAPGWRQLCY